MAKSRGKWSRAVPAVGDTARFTPPLHALHPPDRRSARSSIKKSLSRTLVSRSLSRLAHSAAVYTLPAHIIRLQSALSLDRCVRNSFVSITRPNDPLMCIVTFESTPPPPSHYHTHRCTARLQSYNMYIYILFYPR